MTEIVLYLMLIGHMLGDFYFQSDKIARGKNTNKSDLIIHIILYGTGLLIALIPVLSLDVFILCIINILLHGVIDFLKNRFNSKSNYVFIIDQAAHVLCITGSIVVFRYLNKFFAFANFLSDLNCEIEILKLVQWITVLLFIFKPCRIAIKVILKKYEPQNKSIKDGKNNAGALIGELERLFIIIMLDTNSYSAIGLVLTAKSIARYKKITDSEQFAEYYLLGTLMSSLMAIIIYNLIFIM